MPTWVVGQPVPAESRLGKLIEGEYKIQGILGQGELGVSYQAYNPRLKRFFAVLMLDRQLMPTHEMMLAVRADLRRAQALGDCGFLPIKLVTDDDGVPGFATELLEGETLRMRLARGAMPVDRALSLIVQVAQALEAAHASGLIHGDLRPDGIFLVRPQAKSRYAGRAVLLKHSLRHLRRRPVGFDDSLPIGKLMYRPPEQVAGQVLEADVSGDLFTLGGLLHECLTGTPAFGGDDVEEVLDRLARPPDLLKANPATGLTAPLAEALNVVVAGACARDPQARIPTMGELLRAIQLVADGAGVPLVEQVADATPPVQLGRISRILHRLSGTFPAVTMPPSRRRDAPAEAGASRALEPAPRPAGARPAEPARKAAEPAGARPAEPARPISGEAPRAPARGPATSASAKAPRASPAELDRAAAPAPAEPARPAPAGPSRPASGESTRAAAEPARPSSGESKSAARPSSGESARSAAEPPRPSSGEAPAAPSATTRPTAGAPARAPSGDSAGQAPRAAAEPAPPGASEATRPLPAAVARAAAERGSTAAEPRPTAAEPRPASGEPQAAPSAQTLAAPAPDLSNELTLPPDAAPQRVPLQERRTLIGQPVQPAPQGAQPASTLLSDTTQPPRPRAPVDLGDAPPVTQRPTQALSRLGGEPPTARMSAARLRLTQQTPMGERSTKQLRARDITQLIAAVQAGKLNAAQAVELAREPEEIQLDERDMLPPSRVRPPTLPTGPTRLPLTTRPMRTSALGSFLLRHQEIVAALLGAATILILGLLLLRCSG